MKKKFSVLNLFALLMSFAVATPAFAADDEFQPYLDGTEHKISEREYEDLRSYVERAQKILMRTLDDSTDFSGTDLRAHLLSGIRTALQSTNLRNELLLFRYVLSRAVEVDEFYTKNETGAEIAQLSAQIVLLPAIESALNYYQSSDLPRLATTTVPSPDWLSFAADQVPQLLRAVDLAPTRVQKVEVVRRALGWTAKALNSAHERRTAEVADLIVRLGELYNYPNPQHSQYVTRAQDALLAVYKAYRKPLPTITIAPASTGTDLKMRRKSLASRAGRRVLRAFGLPLLGIKTGGVIGWDDTGTQLSNGAGNRGPDLARTTVVIGAGKSATYYGNEDGTADVKNAAIFKVDIAYIRSQLGESTYGDKFFGGVYGELSGHARPGANASELTYSTRALLSANIFVAGAAYVAIDVNKFERFSETFFRLGYAPQFMLRIGNMEYVAFRASVDYWVADCNIAAGNGETPCSRKLSGVGGSLGIVLHKKRFSAALNANIGRNGYVDSSDEDHVDVRRAADALVTFPLGILLRNDAVILKGEAVDYSDGGPSSASGLMFYGLTW